MKLSKRQNRIWRYYISQLKTNFNPGVPVAVRSVPLEFCGDCEGILKLGRLTEIRIRIDSKGPWQVKVDALIHEWAHAMEWEASLRDISLNRIHNETWGVWYAKIYQHLYDRCWVDMGRRGLLTKKELETFPLNTYRWTE